MGDRVIGGWGDGESKNLIRRLALSPYHPIAPSVLFRPLATRDEIRPFGLANLEKSAYTVFDFPMIFGISHQHF